MRVKGGLVTLIYRKSLVLSNGEKSGRTTGDIVNLQSVDAVRIADLAQYGHIAWSGPFQVGLSGDVADRRSFSPSSRYTILSDGRRSLESLSWWFR
jgi:hypothetical protein